ncbi:MAG: NUDIX domain-containing protein [bacterium]|nr:NUDIX domain-containing protein [bacterium]
MIREFSAGGIVYKKEGDQMLWLIRRPKGNSEYRGNLGWTLPKGWIDEGETIEQAALRETAEEAGVRAKIIEKLPSFKVFYTNKEGEKVLKFITYFVMEWREDIEEGFGSETEETRWLGQKEAAELLVHKNERDLLEKAAEKSK